MLGVGLTIPEIAVRRRNNGVPPLTRVPIVSVTDGGATTADSALILASATNRRNARMVTTTAARDFRMTLGTITGTGGALLFLDSPMNNASWATVQVDYSGDGFVSDINACTVVLFAPSGDSGYGNRGQHAIIPAAASGKVLRLRYTASAANQAFFLGLVNISSNKKKNAIFGATGTSYERIGLSAQTTIDTVNQLYPLGDVLVFNLGRTGGQISVANNTIYNEAFSHIATTLPFCAYWFVQPWSNEVYQVARGVPPYIYAGDASTAKSDITNMSPQFASYATANNLTLSFASLPFFDFKINDPNAGNPAVDQSAASGGPFPEKGAAPYNVAEVYQAIKTNTPDSIDSSIGVARFDLFSRVLSSWENQITTDGVHPSASGSNMLQQCFTDFVVRVTTGTWPKSWIERMVERYEGRAGAPASVITRLQYCMTQLPPAENAGQTAARAALSARLAAIPTTFTEPTLTGAAVLPTALTGISQWWDFADFTKFTVGQVSTNTLAPASFDLVGAVASVANKSTGGALEQTTTAIPCVRPIYIPKGAPNGVDGILDFNHYALNSSTGVVLNAAAGSSVIGMLDAGNPELLIGFTIDPSATQGKTWLTFTAGAVNLRIGPAGASTYSKCRVIDTATVIMTDPSPDTPPGTTVCFVIACAAGAWSLYRNGVLVTTGSRTLAARTGTAFTAFAGSSGKSRGLVMASGAGAAGAGNIAGLNAYLQQASGAY